MRMNKSDLDPYYIADNNCITIKLEYIFRMNDNEYQWLMMRSSACAQF